MNLTPVFPHLTDRLAGRLIHNVTELEAAVAAGMVPNVLFIAAKDAFNAAVEAAAEAFLSSGPHIVGRDGEAHHQSDWWLSAYDHDAFVRGAHGLPTIVKRAQKGGMTEYATFLGALLPLADLLQAAKPLVKKRGELPVVKSAKQIADEADQMTCQCCGRGIFAATGTIAHHGYERPGHGYQTASCMGAKELPFEVDRAVLSRVIAMLGRMQTNMQAARGQTERELRAIERSWTTGLSRNRQTHTFAFTRKNFDSLEGKAARRAIGIYGGFDELLGLELASQDRAIESLAADIAAQQARYDGWKQTHKRVGDAWVAM